MKYSYRVTKYNKKNEQGYLVSSDDEWTSFSDIGDKVSEKGYIKTEEQYINFVTGLCDFFGVQHLSVKELELNSEWVGYSDGQCLDIIEIRNAVRSILRDDMWCKLVSDVLEFHFGYDYYMYFVSNECPKEFIDRIKNQLSIEEIRSPYLQM